VKAGIKVSRLDYVIIVIEAAWYPVFLVMVMIVVHLVTQHRENKYRLALGDVVLDLKDMIFQEEIKVVQEELTKQSELTLTGLLTYAPTAEDYTHVVDMLVKLAKNRVAEDRVLIHKSTNEVEIANLIQVISNWSEDPELHKEIFSYAFRKNMDMRVIQGLFAQQAAMGNVIALGDNAIVITDDFTGNPPTNVSPINSGLEGSEICFLISFIKKENYDAWRKENEPKEEENEEA